MAGTIAGVNRAMRVKWIGAACVAVALVGGCQNKASTKPVETAAVRGDVTDIRPMPSATPAYQPSPYQAAAYSATPAASAQPISTETSTTPTAAIASTGNTHMVKRGETLYSIAKINYGDGKQWQKLASANPGVSPSTLKVGQTLVVP